MRPVVLFSSDGESLEAGWDYEANRQAAVVFCHPGPQQQGTMRAPLMNTVTNRLVEHGFSVLRFNFRGVGKSTGSHGNGSTEVYDVAAAMSSAKAEFSIVHLAGWSFGAATALQYLAESTEPARYVGIAPPSALLPDPASLLGQTIKIIVGDRDKIIDVKALRIFAEATGAELEIFKGSDHFFHFREVKVANAMASFFAGPSLGL